MTTEPFLLDEDITAQPEHVAPRSRWADLPVHLTLLIIGLAIATPIIISFFISFTPLRELVSRANPSILPDTWTFDNYEKAWNATPFGRFVLNSFIQTGIITAAQVLFSILAGYAFAMFEFKFKNALFAILIGSLIVPFELTFIPNFLLISDLGWANTYAGLTVPFLASAFGVFMMRQFFLSIPRDLYDAAKIDGASDWKYLWAVMTPLSKGAISAFTIFAFLSAWNQYLWPLIITNEENMRTAQIGIRFFLVNQERATDWGAIMAGAVIVMIPTLLVFIVAQKQLVKGIAASGLKG
ncbi:MAG: carbohydrate ABC transporter permease [Acidimicrobiia bacterium]|nr:carbohydrate ABC transporter permease [Acidimicrobiia bacterium]NNF11270.1 carbohydrate ABC transporter permease [Acidimicrobiia bacterium]NNL69005.1 carbohydrate ABC transporter permease [Acidimicrobiia bacterium]